MLLQHAPSCCQRLCQKHQMSWFRDSACKVKHVKNQQSLRIGPSMHSCQHFDHDELSQQSHCRNIVNKHVLIILFTRIILQYTDTSQGQSLHLIWLMVTLQNINLQLCHHDSERTTIPKGHVWLYAPTTWEAVFVDYLSELESTWMYVQDHNYSMVLPTFTGSPPHSYQLH